MDHQETGHGPHFPPIAETGESSQLRAQHGQNPHRIDHTEGMRPLAIEFDDNLVASAEALVVQLQDLFENHSPEDLVGSTLANRTRAKIQITSREELVRTAMKVIKVQKEVAEALDCPLSGRLRQLLANVAKESDQRAEADSHITTIACRECLSPMSNFSRFYACQDCVGTDYYVMCLSCFFKGKPHRHERFICQELYPLGVRQPPIKSHFDRGNVAEDEVPPKGKAKQDSHLLTNKDLPLSQVLRRYLEATDLQSHLYIDAIKHVQGFPEELITNNQVYRTLKGWAVTCMLVADFDFSKRPESRGQPSLMAVLSPSQRVSVRLLKEWWFSEIQDPTFMMKTFAHSLSNCIFANNDGTRPVINHDKNQYLKHYHGDLLQLFQEEFEVLSSGDSLSTPQQLELTRQTAINSSCCQRMGQLSLHGRSTRGKSGPTTALSGVITPEAIMAACDDWRRDVIKACAKILVTAKMIGAPEPFFWWVLEVILEGPILLCKESSLHPDVVLDSNSLSVWLEPLPWLAKSTRSNDLPFYLWDRRLSRTVETSTLEKPLDYIAISHTWGRWKTSGTVELPGVDWGIPRNEIWNVDRLPNEMRQVPGHQRYIWFDLVCIPQGPETPRQRDEVLKQAAIFSKAAHAVAWLSTMKEFGMKNLHKTVALLSEGSGTFFRALKRTDPEPPQDPRQDRTPFFEWEDAIERGLEKLRGPDGKILAVMDMVPLVEDDLRPQMGQTRDSQQYINRWFTSLWTLQEACMRPDMWICSLEWKPLRLGPETLRDDYRNVSLDAVFSLLESSMPDAAMRQDPLDTGVEVKPGTEDETMARYQTLLAQLSRRLRSEDAANLHGRKEAWTFFKREIEASGLPIGKIPSWDLDEMDNLRTGAKDASRGRGSRIYSTFDAMKQLPSDAHIFRDMLRATGMTRFAKLRSRMDIVAIGERRTCKRLKDRAEAIMSAVGVVEWYDPQRSRDEPDLPRILDLYPVEFVRELRREAGHADFFRSRTLNKSVMRRFGPQPDLTPLGSMLPFSGSSAPSMNITLIPSTSLEDSLPVEGHASLEDWSVNLDGSVHMPHAAVAVKTRNPGMMDMHAECNIAGHRFVVDVAKGESIDNFSGKMHDWLRRERDIADTCFLVVLSRQQTAAEKVVHWSTSHAVLLRELKPNVLVKVGMFTLSGDNMTTWPPRTRRNWTVI